MTQTLKPTITTILLGAAEVLRKNHWGTGMVSCSLPDGSLSVCAVGAVEVYLESLHLEQDEAAKLETSAINKIYDVLWKSHPERPSLTTWNDRHAKSKEDVISLFEASAQ